MTRPGAITGVARAWRLLLLLAACKGGSHHSPPPAPGPAGAAVIDAGLPDADLDMCRAQAARIASLPPTERPQALLDACRPCGDWAPLLAWNTPPTEHGPTRAAIEQAMAACKAYCEPNAKQRFLGTLDGARGQPTRTPWRLLGETCKAEVSALPDARFMTAPYFALDRIARALGPARDPAIAIPLPAVSITGVGVELPDVAGAAHEAGPVALTLDASQVLLGALPIATLSAAGLAVTGDYPGTPIAPGGLAAALARPPNAGQPATLLAPHALAATRVAEVVRAAAGHPIRLAAAVPGPLGWSLAGTLSIALVARPARGGVTLALTDAPPPALAAVAALPASPGPITIAIAPAATVDGLAAVLAALAARGIPEAVLAILPTAPEPAR